MRRFFLGQIKTIEFVKIASSVQSPSIHLTTTNCSGRNINRNAGTDGAKFEEKWIIILTYCRLCPTHFSVVLQLCDAFSHSYSVVHEFIIFRHETRKRIFYLNFVEIIFISMSSNRVDSCQRFLLPRLIYVCIRVAFVFFFVTILSLIYILLLFFIYKYILWQMSGATLVLCERANQRRSSVLNENEVRRV